MGFISNKFNMLQTIQENKQTWKSSHPDLFSALKTYESKKERKESNQSVLQSTGSKMKCKYVPSATITANAMGVKYNIVSRRK